MTTFRRGVIVCPCCQGKYTVDVVLSTIWSGEVSTDLLRYSMGKMPINSLVHSCPGCGWSGKGEHPDPEPETIKRFIRERITPLLDGLPVPPWRRWEFYAWIREAGGANALELGETYLVASQCARLGQEPEEEESLRGRSIAHFEKAVEKGEVPQDSIHKITYLLGELHRRSGDASKAEGWFQKVCRLDLEPSAGEFFQDLSRRQMADPGDMIGEGTKSEEEMIRGGALSGFLRRLLPRKNKRP